MRRVLGSSGKLSLALLLGCFALMVDGAARAQEPKVLNLEQLIDMALQHSPEINEAEQDVAMANADLDQAKGGQWPQLDMKVLTGPVTDAHRPTVTVKTTPGSDGRLHGTLDEESSSDIGPFGMLNVTLSQPLFTFGKISYRKQAAERGVKARQIALQAKRGEVVQKVKELYYGLIVAGQGTEAASDATSFVDDAHGRIERLLKAGSTNVDENDLYRLEAFGAGIRQFKIKAESGRRTAYEALKTAIGLPPGQEFTLDVKELPKNNTALATMQEYVNKALQSRPELLQLREGVEAQRNLVKAAKADMYPSFFASVVAFLATAPGREEFDNPYITDEFNRTDAGIVFGAEWHFDFGIGQGKLKKARAEYQKMLHTKDFAEKNIPLEVMKYYEDAVSNKQSSSIFEKSAIASRKWVVASFSNFDLGVGTAKDMLDALSQYGKNQGDYLDALYNYHLSVVKLQGAIGEYGIKMAQ